MTTINRRGMLKILGASTMSLGALTRPSFGAKPAPPPPPPPLPPVRYEIQYWSIPTPIPTKLFGMSTMNNLGQVAGWYVNPAGDQRAYLYDPEINPASAFDLQSEFAPTGVPEGWKIASAAGINNLGLVVGYLSPVGTGYGAVQRAYVMDLATAQVVPLTNWHDWDSHYARKINDNGDILAAYENADGSTGLYFYNPNDPQSPYVLDDVRTLAFLNNPVGDRPAQVGGTFGGDAHAHFRWTPQLDPVPEMFGSLTTYNASICGINDAGAMCGWTTIQSGRKYTVQYPFHLNTSVQLLSNAYGPSATSINSSGDVLLSNRGGIYRDDWSAYGNYADINKLVVGTEDDLAFWASSFSRECIDMNDRGPLNAGQIAGRLFIPDTNAFHPFLLIPIAP